MTADIVHTAQGQSGATYIISSVQSRDGWTDYEVKRSGGVTPGGKPLHPQHCGTYNTLGIAMGITDDLIRITERIYVMAAEYAQRKKKRAAAALDEPFW